MCACSNPSFAYTQPPASFAYLCAEDRTFVESLLVRVEQLERKLAGINEHTSKSQCSITDSFDTVQLSLGSAIPSETNESANVLRDSDQCALLASLSKYLCNSEYSIPSWHSNCLPNSMRQSSSLSVNSLPTHSHFRRFPVPCLPFPILHGAQLPNHQNYQQRPQSAVKYRDDSYRPPPENKCFKCGNLGRHIVTNARSTFVLCDNC